jgi:hypothetical protein
VKDTAQSTPNTADVVIRSTRNVFSRVIAAVPICERTYPATDQAGQHGYDSVRRADDRFTVLNI